MVAPKLIWVTESESLDLHDWCELQAERFTKEYASIPLFFTDKCILHFIDVCSGDGELKEGLTEDEMVVAKSVCQLLTRSAEIEVSKHLPEPEPELSAGEIQMIEECSQQAPGLIPEPEQTIEPVEEPEAPLEPATAQGSPLQAAYNASIAAQQASKEAVRGKLTVLPPKEIGALERSIIDAAMESRLDNSYTQLSEVFNFGVDMTSVTLKGSAQPSPVEFGRLFGMGNDMGRKSLWICGEAINFLLVLGHEDAVHSIADQFGFSYSHASNLARVVQRVSAEKRIGLPPSVAVEIAASKYSENPQENQEIIDKAIDQAKEEGWNCLQARSHSRMLRGKDEEINEGKESLKDKVKRLEKAFGDILNIEEPFEGEALGKLLEAQDIARKALGIIESMA